MITISEMKALAEEAQSPPAELQRLYEFCRFDRPEEGAAHAYYKFLYLLVRHTHPETIVELGTELGRSAFAMALGYPDSMVHTIDISGRVPSTWGQYLASLPNIVIHSGQDTTDWGLHHRDLSIELLFIDSDHSYSTVVKEYHTYRPLMEPGGVVVFDDALHAGPKRLLAEIALPKIIFDGIDAPQLHGPNGFCAVLIPRP